MFFRVTIAPGIEAPEESLTVPKIVPVGNWAATGIAAKMSTAITPIVFLPIHSRNTPMFPPVAEQQANRPIFLHNSCRGAQLGRHRSITIPKIRTKLAFENSATKNNNTPAPSAPASLMALGESAMPPTSIYAPFLRNGERA